MVRGERVCGERQPRRKICRNLNYDGLASQRRDADSKLRRVQSGDVQDRRLDGYDLNKLRSVQASRSAAAGNLREECVNTRRGIARGQRDVGGQNVDGGRSVRRNRDLT